jgi:hypothetical protein
MTRYSRQELEKAIELYKKDLRREDGSPKSDRWSAACGNAGSLSEAIAIAASAHLCGLSSLPCVSRGCKHPHQRHIFNELLAHFARSLQEKSRDLEGAGDFEQIISIVSAAAPHGIGPLAVYDAAFRLGARLGIRPGLVYLHSGTLAGARILGITAKGSIAKDQLPEPLKNSDLDPGELENFLCIFIKKNYVPKLN